jgi:hypothetical protein
MRPGLLPMGFIWATAGWAQGTYFRKLYICNTYFNRKKYNEAHHEQGLDCPLLIAIF